MVGVRFEAVFLCGDVGTFTGSDLELLMSQFFEPLYAHGYRGEFDAAGHELLRHAAQQTSAFGRAAHDLEELHRCDRQRKGLRFRQAAGVGQDARDLESALLRPPGQLVEQLGIRVQGRQCVPAIGQVERHPSRSCSEIQDRPGRPPRQLAPNRKVGGVAGAFEVVPDHRVPHSDHRLARPRLVSMSRRSSRAVYVGSA